MPDVETMKDRPAQNLRGSWQAGRPNGNANGELGDHLRLFTWLTVLAIERPHGTSNTLVCRYLLWVWSPFVRRQTLD